MTEIKTASYYVLLWHVQSFINFKNIFKLSVWGLQCRQYDKRGICHYVLPGSDANCWLT